MFKYKGVSCPHCEKEFTENDQILICPDCGAPYHRACIQELGNCMFPELHEKGESWQPPKSAAQMDEEKYDGMASRRCSRCGTISGPDTLFCEVCGNPLNRPEKEESADKPLHTENDNTASEGGFKQFMQGGPLPGVHQMAYNPYTTPFGGLGADETIEDIPVKDLALFVGQNTQYFLPKFKEMAGPKKSSNWNWAAFFLDSYYLLYRKMWGWAALATVLFLLVSIPSSLVLYNVMLANLGAEMFVSEGTLTFLNNLSGICSILSLAMKLAVATCTNWLYKAQVFRSVKKLRAEKSTDPQYSTILTAKGGVSMKAVLLFLLISVVLSFAASFLLVGTIPNL